MGKIIGLPLVECFRIFLEDDELAKKAVEIFRERYEEIFLEKTYLAPGVLGTLRKLKELGYKIGVLSNKLGEKLRRLIKHLGISEFIDIAIGEGDILHHNKNAVMKPDPRTVYFIVEELGVSPEKTVIVGDTEVDMETAIRANMSFVALYSSSRTPKYFEETWRKQKENGNSEESKKQKTFLYLISSFDGLINLAHFFKIK
jgi:phosphoglycolate phosphatase